MRALRLLVVLTLGAAGAVSAQLAVPQSQNLEKLLVLALPVAAAADSSASVASMNVARDRLSQLARYKVFVVPRAKICEALTQSGFPCDGLMSDQQASQLARALGINSYTTGQLTRSGSTLIAKIHVVSGAAGFASSFTINGGPTPDVLGEAIAQRLNKIVRAGEFARSCHEQRARGAFERALAEARKAFAIEPNLAAANLCMATVFEAKRAPVDSVIAAAFRALLGDPGNGEAWGMVASKSLVKGDTSGAYAAYDSMLSHNPADANLRKGLAQLLLQQRRYDRAEQLLRAGLELNPSDQQMRDLRRRVCIDGGLNSCVLDILAYEVKADSSKLADTTTLKLGIGAAQQAADTQAMLWWSQAAVRHFPKSASFHKQLAAAYTMAGKVDSAVSHYKLALATNPNDVSTSLLIAQTIVDRAVWDTTLARALSGDTAALRRARQAFADRLDAARPYLAAGFASRDSSIRLFTTNIAYTGGSKLAQAGALDRAYPWLEQAFQQLATDTVTSHQPLRSITGYWYGLTSTYTLPPLLQALAASKKCDQAPALNDRIQRSKQALNLGARVAPQAVRQPLSAIAQFEGFMQQVKKSFKCNF